MNKESIKELRDKILKGIELAYERLIILKQKEDADVVFSSEGKIIRVKARDLKK